MHLPPPAPLNYQHFLFFHPPPPPDTYTLSLHDALPICSRIEAVAAPDPIEALGINDRKQLAAVAAILRRRILDRLMADGVTRSEEHTSELQSRGHLVCRLLLEKKKKTSPALRGCSRWTP